MADTTGVHQRPLVRDQGVDRAGPPGAPRDSVAGLSLAPAGLLETPGAFAVDASPHLCLAPVLTRPLPVSASMSTFPPVL